MHSDEQHPTTSSAIGKDVRVDGRRQARGGRGEHIKGAATTAERRSGRFGYTIREQFGTANNGFRQGARRPSTGYQRRRTGYSIAAGTKKQRNRGGR